MPFAKVVDSTWGRFCPNDKASGSGKGLKDLFSDLG